MWCRSTSSSDRNPKLSFFGLGDDTLESDRATFRMRQTIAGARVAWPIGRTGALNRLGLSLIGEANGRWVKIGNGTLKDVPGIDTLFTDDTAPGLDDQPATLQLGEGVRITPGFGRLQLIYTARLQQFIAADSAFSFRRWEIDLQHDFALHTTRREAATRDFNTPNNCSVSLDRVVGEYSCPDPMRVTTNRTGLSPSSRSCSFAITFATRYCLLSPVP